MCRIRRLVRFGFLLLVLEIEVLICGWDVVQISSSRSLVSPLFLNVCVKALMVVVVVGLEKDLLVWTIGRWCA